MAGARKPGPQCSFNHPVNVDDGTTYRAVSLPPGPLGAALDHDGVGHGSHTPGNASECVLGAYQRAIQVAPNAVYRETGYQLGEIPGLVPRLQALIAIFAPDVAQGGARGAANSALAVSDPGSDSGRAIFTSLGITFLQDFIGNVHRQEITA